MSQYPGYPRPAPVAARGANPAYGGAPWGPPTGPRPGGYAPPGFPAPQAPRPRRRGPWGVVLGAALVLGMIGLGVLIANSLFGQASTVPYANEDYTPPPVEQPDDIPVPETYEQLDEFLYANPVNAERVASPIRCEINRVDTRTASDPELEGHFNALMGCEMTTWDRTLESAGWQLFRPPVTIYDTPIQTPCGEMPQRNAAYCAANQQLYYASDLPNQPGIEQEASNPTAMDLVMAHEFGHALQGRTGQFAAATILMQDASKEDQLLMSRRIETQADCYAGLYLASAAQSTPYTQEDFDNFLNLAEQLGSDNLTGDPDILSTHPRGEARRYWVQTGLSTTEIGKCSTYNVSDERLTN